MTASQNKVFPHNGSFSQVDDIDPIQQTSFLGDQSSLCLQQHLNQITSPPLDNVL